MRPWAAGGHFSNLKKRLIIDGGPAALFVIATRFSEVVRSRKFCPIEQQVLRLGLQETREAVS